MLRKRSTSIGRKKSRSRSPPQNRGRSRSPVRMSFPGNSWTVYTMKGCDWCKKAKEMLQKKGEKVVAIQGEGNKELENKMKKIGKSNYDYWPKIFKNDTFIGGYKELEKMLKN